MSELKTFQDFIEVFNQLTPDNRLKILNLLFELAGAEQESLSNNTLEKEL